MGGIHCTSAQIYRSNQNLWRLQGLTINQAVKLDKYPIPNINDLFTKLTGGVMYTKLDLSHAYQQVVLDEESRKLTTINTSKGLLEYI